MGFQLDGTTVSSVLIGVAALLAYLVSQLSAKAREDRRRLRRLVKRDIAWTRWGHNVRVWVETHGHRDLPELPAILNDTEDEG